MVEIAPLFERVGLLDIISVNFFPSSFNMSLLNFVIYCKIEQVHISIRIINLLYKIKNAFD